MRYNLPMRVIFTFAIILIIFLTITFHLDNLNTQARSRNLRSCLTNLKPNGDQVTIDIEDLELCKRAYDNRTSYAGELYKAIGGININGRAKLL